MCSKLSPGVSNLESHRDGCCANSGGKAGVQFCIARFTDQEVSFRGSLLVPPQLSEMTESGPLLCTCVSPTMTSFTHLSEISGKENLNNLAATTETKAPASVMGIQLKCVLDHY